MDKTKIIFLDIDGVLNDCETIELNRDCIKKLNTLVEDSGASIVLSSACRLGFSISRFQLAIENAGFKFPERIIGCTSDLLGERDKEISLWLKQIKVDSFVILDNTNDMGVLSSNLVLTNKGLTDSDVEKAKKILRSR